MDSEDEDAVADELQPRTSLRPTPAPFYNAPFKSSVPEVSLIFNNASPEGATAMVNRSRPRPLSPHVQNNSKPPERQPSDEFESYNAWKYKNLKGSPLNKNGTMTVEDPSTKFKHYVSSPNYSTNNRIGLSDRNELGSSIQTPYAAPSEHTYNQPVYCDVHSNNDHFPRMAPLQLPGYRTSNASTYNQTREYPNELPIFNRGPISPPRNYQLNSQQPYGQLRTSTGFESGEPMPMQFDPQNINRNPLRGRPNYNTSDFQLPNQRFESVQHVPRNIPLNHNNPSEYQQTDPNHWSPRQYLDHMANTAPLPGHAAVSSHDACCHSNRNTQTVDSHYTSLAANYDHDRSGQNNQSAARDHSRATNYNNSSRDVGVRNSAKRTTASAVSDLCRVVQLQNEQLQILQSQVAQLLSHQLKQDHFNAIEYSSESRHNMYRPSRRDDQGFSANSRKTNASSDKNRGPKPNLVTKVQNSNLNERQERAENGNQIPGESFAWDKSMNFSVVDETSPHGDMNDPNTYGSIVQKVSIGVMTSFMDPAYFNNTGALQKNETRRQAVNRPNELLQPASRPLGARSKTHNNQESQPNERENQQQGGEMQTNEVLPSSLNAFRGNETQLNDLVGLETQPKEVWTPPTGSEPLPKDVNRGTQNSDCQNQASSNLDKDLPQAAAAFGAGHGDSAAPLCNSRVRQWAEQAAAGSPLDSTRSTPGSAYVNESITLNGLDFPGPVAEHLPSPASSVHVDIQDYRSSDDGSPVPFGTCRDDLAADSPGEEGERIGWTFYNNVVGQVNEILQSHPSRRCYESDASQDGQPTRQLNRTRQHNAYQQPHNNGAGGDPRPAPRNHGNAEAVRNATLEQLRQLGVSSYDPDQANNGAAKKVTFDSVYYNCPRMDFLRMSQEAKESSDISVRMNALAMKYLKDDQINEYVRLASGTNGHDVAVYNVATKKTNHSFATMRYLERYHLVPAAPRDQRRDHPVNGGNQGRIPTRQEPIPSRPMEGNNAWANPYQYNQPKAPNKILDITALKQQPKFI